MTSPVNKKIRAIITGATGMVGEGVLYECLLHPDVERVLVIGRKPSGMQHPKLTEIVHNDFWDIGALKPQLSGYNVCYFCLGVSSVGMDEAQYTRVTYDLTLHVAGVLAELNPEMVFCYVTGSGTDSTEQGRSMWARVKGKTENHLLRLPFKRAVMFRPGYIHPTPGLQRAHPYYRYLAWLYPPLKKLFPNSLITLRQLGLAMIHATFAGQAPSIAGPKEIIRLAESSS